MVKARQCGCCRRELVERDRNDHIVEWWNNRLQKWFNTPINPDKFYTTYRKNFFTNSLRKVKVWVCKCGYLNEERDDQPNNKEAKSTSIPNSTLDSNTFKYLKGNRVHRGQN